MLIAEIGLNHNGSEALVHEMIRQIALSNVTHAKMQLGWRDGPEEINHWSLAQVAGFKETADNYGVELFVSIFKERYLEWVDALSFKTIKIASRTANEPTEWLPQIAHLSSVSSIIVSNGFNPQSPPLHLEFLRSDQKQFNLWCVSEYPTPPAYLGQMPKKFGETEVYQGVSDHFLGTFPALVALARGARIIEKHVSFDKSERCIRDHQVSIDFEELRMLKRMFLDAKAHKFQSSS